MKYLSAFLCIIVFACSSGDPAPDNPGNQTAPQNTLADRISEIQNQLLQMDGSIPNPYAFQIVSQSYDHSFDVLGYAYCVPTNPLANPNPASASGTTNIYGCVNNLSVSYTNIDTSTIRLTIDLPNVYIDMDGNMLAIGFNGDYVGYINGTNILMSFDVAVNDNGDNTFSFGTTSLVTIYPPFSTGLGFASMTLNTDMAALNTLLTGGLLPETDFYTPMTVPYYDIRSALDSLLPTIAPFTM